DEFMSMTIDKIDAGYETIVKSSPSEYGFHDAVKSHRNEVYRHQQKNGKVILVEIKKREILFHGKPAVIVVAHDITEHINYIDEIEKQNQRFSEISWIQSHVVRAPIARLMGLIDLIKHPSSDEKLKTELLGYVLESAHELDEIVKDITIKSELIDLNRASNSGPKS
ncbi:MAG: hypothetical protein WKF69_13330, partial [Daejeonella sp.]